MKHWSHYHRTKETPTMLTHEDIELLKRVVTSAEENRDLALEYHIHDCSDVECPARRYFDAEKEELTRAKELLERLELAQ